MQDGGEVVNAVKAFVLEGKGLKEAIEAYEAEMKTDEGGITVVADC